MLLLSIESSCDETSVALVENGRRVLANEIASQIAKHVETGGVVPEVAAREHMTAILPVLRLAMEKANVTWKAIDAVAVTKEPGLIGSLVVGRMTAAALAFAQNKPLLEVNHIHGHLYAPWLYPAEDSGKPVLAPSEPQFPILVLTVSGGHNELVLMRGHGDFELLAESIDDAAGEAFDKIARLLGLGYPGGPAIEERARLGNPKAFDFPIALRKEKNFSFSGLKTSVFYRLKENEAQLSDEAFVNDVAASFQEAVVQALVEKLMRAVREYAPKEVHLTGGVSANRFLRGRIEEELSRLRDAPLFRWPTKMEYCTDNAAMIGAAAYFSSQKELPLALT
ncbi:tRNA (adenosine(37)-N6)-threonylcarbamoyltransferase complex transferase subunit TsaD [Candidatus Peregrinibacteria bacterium]|nr:MAG: tRNA (adenosine(37)-N6)-threonylcarbamoyltransferase complex transferase subunit TsaD [Candidatus Peregrinibacteria bacterium]